MRLEFDPKELRKLVATVAAELVPTIFEQAKRPDREIWTHADLARELGVTQRTLSEYRDQGLITGSLPGRSWVYSRQAVLEFLSRTQVN